MSKPFTIHSVESDTMRHQTVCYHTRDSRDNTKKLNGGTFTKASTLDETINRLASTFTVEFTATGRAVFVDKQGRAVDLYVSVHPEFTTTGIEAIKAYRVRRDQERAEAAKRAHHEQAELDAALNGLSHAEAIRRLTNPKD